MGHPYLALLGVLCLVVYLINQISPSRQRYKRIPGPPGLPVIGNALQLQDMSILKKWSRQYGDIFQIKVGPSQTWIFLNSPRHVKELLEKQSAVTSTRPNFVSARLVSNNMRMVLMPYGDRWRTLRSIIHPLLTPKASSLIEPAQEFESKQVLWDIYSANKTTGGENGIPRRETAFYDYVRRYSASVMLTMVYGIRAPNWGSNAITQIYEVMEDFGIVANPVYGAIDAFPWLLRLPKFMHWWHKDLKKAADRQNRVWLHYWNAMKQKIERGEAPDCFARQFVQAGYLKKGIEELQAAYVCGTMIEAGSDTTSASINAGILYLSADSNVVAKAQEEIDRVVGNKRSPTFQDQLPYIRAITKEVLRIRPATTTGGPHAADRDIEYDGYLIPKGAGLMLHQNGIQSNPTLYPNPDKFLPDRFLGHPQKAGEYVGIADPYQRDHWAYGTGRRICSGMHVAENSLYILFAKLLWAFKILPPLDDNRVEISVDTSDDRFIMGAVTLPRPFRCRFIPRNSEVEETLVNEWTAAEADGFWLGDRKVNLSGIAA